MSVKIQRVVTILSALVLAVIGVVGVTALYTLILTNQGQADLITTLSADNQALREQVFELGEQPVAPPPDEREDEVTQGATGATGPAGPQGPKGEQGEPGKDGVDGVDGQDGAPGAPGQNGSNGADGATGPMGPAGPQGPAGPTCPDGMVLTYYWVDTYADDSLLTPPDRRYAAICV